MTIERGDTSCCIICNGTVTTEVGFTTESGNPEPETVTRDCCYRYMTVGGDTNASVRHQAHLIGWTTQTTDEGLGSLDDDPWAKDYCPDHSRPVLTPEPTPAPDERYRSDTGLTFDTHEVAGCDYLDLTFHGHTITLDLDAINVAPGLTNGAIPWWKEPVQAHIEINKYPPDPMDEDQDRTTLWLVCPCSWERQITTSDLKDTTTRWTDHLIDKHPRHPDLKG